MRINQCSKIVLAAAALAVGSATIASAAPEAAKKAPAASVGMQMAVNPATGQVRQPTAAEMQALSSDFALRFLTSKSAPQSTQWPDGTISLVLGADSLSVSIARVNADGTLSQACVTGLDQAAALVAGGGATLEEK